MLIVLPQKERKGKEGEERRGKEIRKGGRKGGKKKILTKLPKAKSKEQEFVSLEDIM